MLRKSSLGLVVALMMVTGCAGMMHPGPDEVLFKSVPSGAVVNLDGKDVGTTPCKVKVDRRAFVVKTRLAGYRESTDPMLYNLNGWIYGNYIWWILTDFSPPGFIASLVGCSIDGGNANDRVACGEITVKLEPTR